MWTVDMGGQVVVYDRRICSKDTQRACGIVLLLATETCSTTDMQTHTHTNRLYSAPLMMPVCLQYQCAQISTSMTGYLWNIT